MAGHLAVVGVLGRVHVEQVVGEIVVAFGVASSVEFRKDREAGRVDEELRATRDRQDVGVPSDRPEGGLRERTVEPVDRILLRNSEKASWG